MDKVISRHIATKNKENAMTGQLLRRNFTVKQTKVTVEIRHDGYEYYLYTPENSTRHYGRYDYDDILSVLKRRYTILPSSPILQDLMEVL